MEVDTLKLGGMGEQWRNQPGREQLEGVSAFGH